MSIETVHFIDEDDSKTIIDLDRAFEDRFNALGAAPWKLPPLLPAAPLAAVDYYENFHHLANLIGTISPGDDHGTSSLANSGLIVPSAACYGVYIQLRDSSLEKTKLVTVNANCARFEDHYEPLVRLGSYSLRELIHLGGLDDTKQFFDLMQSSVQHFVEQTGLPITLEGASDSFFKSSSPKARLQKLTKSKLELVYNGELAVGSINFHRNFFGERFNISMRGEPIFTSCFGVGLERWAYMLQHHSSGIELDALRTRVLDSVSEWGAQSG